MTRLDPRELSSGAVSAIALPFAARVLPVERHERMRVIVGIQTSRPARAGPSALKPETTPAERGRRHARDACMREGRRRDHGHNALPRLRRGEDEDLQAYIKRIARQERKVSATISSP